MAYTSLYKNIIFVEGDEPSAKILCDLKYDKHFTFNSQSKTLDCVKDEFVKKAISMGGNAIVDFTYGQKTLGWFKSLLFELDDNIIDAVFAEYNRLLDNATSGDAE